jgi:hypothetical protein
VPCALAACTVLITGCTDTHVEQPAVLRVRAVLESTHLGTDGQLHAFHTPLAGKHVMATDPSGHRITVQVGGAGTVTIHLPAGRYVLTLSERDVCYPTHVALRPGEVRAIALPCVAP